MRFAYEAMTIDGSIVRDALDADERSVAVDSLRSKGLMILKLGEVEDRTVQSARGWSLSSLLARRSRVRRRDLVVFTRQMKMLLESGSPVVPALCAAETQTRPGEMRCVIGRLREAVEGGGSLSNAMAAEAATFDPVFRSLVAAGEATATLSHTFGRLSTLLEQQQRVAKQVGAAIVYPAVLTVLIVNVLSVMIFFVVPRFRGLFSSMRAELPASTALLFALSDACLHGWPAILAGIGGLVVAIIACFRWPPARRRVDDLLLRTPLLGKLISRLILARVMRIWAAMLRCRVPLLETIQLSREAVTNRRILGLLQSVEESVAGGGRLGQAIGAVGLADPILVSALQVGEDNGRLHEAADFVSTWLDDDNATAIQNVTRLAEPVLLALMGVVVGFVALSLFVPLFDMATMAR